MILSLLEWQHNNDNKAESNMNKVNLVTIDPFFELDSSFNSTTGLFLYSYHQQMRLIQQSIRLIQRSYAGLLNTARLPKAQQRLQHLQQLVLDLNTRLEGQNGQWYQDILNWANKLMGEAHTNFYIQHYLRSLECARQSKRPEVIQHYLQRGMEILLNGLNDLYADHTIIQQYIQRYAGLQERSTAS